MIEPKIKDMAFKYANDHANGNWMALYDAYLEGARESARRAYTQVMASGDDALEYIERMKEELHHA